MTFKDVALKNFKSHMKKYIICFLCSSFSIMTLFVYSTLLFGDMLKSNSLSKDGLDLLMYISMGAVIAFSIFFINYSTHAFLKSRYKEFGVMMTLGLNKKDILKMIILENIIIFLGSLAIGIATGALFSRLFQMAVADILSLGSIEYTLTYKSFLFTAAVFAVIFISEIIMFVLFARKLSIEDMMKKFRENEGRYKVKILPGIIGTLIFIVSVIAIYIIGDSESLRSKVYLPVITIIAMFVGVYFIISTFGMMLLVILKKIPGAFNRNIIAITSINKKFNEKKKVIFILTLLSTLVVFAIAPPAALMNEAESVVDLNKHELEIASVYGLNNISDDKVKQIAKKYDIKTEKVDKFEFIPVSYKSSCGGIDITTKKVVISESQYNKLAEYKVLVEKGEAVKVLTSWTPDNDKMIAGDNVQLFNDNSSTSVKVKGIIGGKWISNDSIIPAKSVLILNSDDYKNIRSWFKGSDIGTCSMYEMSKWKGQDDFAKEIRQNIKNDPTENAKEYLPLMSQYMFMAKPFLYNSMKQGYKFFLFITSIMGILFFIASAAVLFFNQYIELDEVKSQFKKLYKIGIVKKEAKKMISGELIVTFFTPVVFGGILAVILMNFTAKIMGGSDMISEFMNSSYKVIAIYFVFQIVFYIFTRINYEKKCLDFTK